MVRKQQRENGKKVSIMHRKIYSQNCVAIYIYTRVYSSQTQQTLSTIWTKASAALPRPAWLWLPLDLQICQTRGTVSIFVSSCQMVSFGKPFASLTVKTHTHAHTGQYSVMPSPPKIALGWMLPLGAINTQLFWGHWQHTLPCPMLPPP